MTAALLGPATAGAFSGRSPIRRRAWWGGKNHRDRTWDACHAFGRIRQSRVVLVSELTGGPLRPSQIEAPGFKPLRHTGIVIDVDSKIVVDAALTIGEKTDTVTVSESARIVETVDTQMGEVITGQQMTAVPLNGRSFTDLLALQSGVVPVTSLTSDTSQDVGVSAFSPSGDLNPGTISINGQREFANSFVLNGSDVEEDVNMGAAIVPNLDSIAEFRILTSNFDAEYGEFSGGQISVVTKSGTNAFHGDVFEFLRNTDLDARNYLFAHARSVRSKPIWRNAGRPDPEEQGLLLRRLSRHAV